MIYVIMNRNNKMMKILYSGLESKLWLSFLRHLLNTLHVENTLDAMGSTKMKNLIPVLKTLIFS